MANQHKITNYAWLSVATAVFTITLKTAAYFLTGSVGLLSDALESGVNLVAAVITLIALTIATQPPDAEHAFGHHKAEYFASGVEGALILVAALTIVITAVNHFINPAPLRQLNIGLVISAVAAIFNFVTARILLQAAQRYRSVALEADARHLMTDVWTSGGVLLGIGVVALSGWQIVDPIIAILVAIQITVSGWRLVRESALGLMDTALPLAEIEKIEAILNQHKKDGVTYHALRTRQSGAQRFVTLHIQVPGAWTVQQGHTLLEEIERKIRQTIPSTSVLTHLEPVEDPVSWQDIELNREDL
jgi:cation diffusion facilitator family transporter